MQGNLSMTSCNSQLLLIGTGLGGKKKTQKNQFSEELLLCYQVKLQSWVSKNIATTLQKGNC